MTHAGSRPRSTRCAQKWHLAAVCVSPSMVQAILASDKHTSMYVRVTGTRDGRSLDVTLAEALTVGPDGRWTEFWSLAEDQDAVDAFWD